MNHSYKTIKGILLDEIKKRRADGLVKMDSVKKCSCEERHGLFPCDSPWPRCALAKKRPCAVPGCECAGAGHLVAMTFRGDDE